MLSFMFAKVLSLLSPLNGYSQAQKSELMITSALESDMT